MDIEETKSRSLLVPSIVLAISLGIMGYFLFFTGEVSQEKSEKILHQQQLTHQVQKMESAIKKKEGELFALASKYKEKTGKEMPLGFNLMELDKKTRKLLEQRIDEEKDISIKSLMEEILEKKKDIQMLEHKIFEIEKSLPTPHIVKEGENHYQIALNFLVNENGLKKEEANELLNRTALYHELAAGFKVWNFYDGEEFGTSISQGDADISPNLLIQLATKKLIDAKDQAILQKDRLDKNVQTLIEKRDQILSQMKFLSQEKEDLLSKVNALNEHVNSLHYLIDSQKNLKEKGIIKSGFLKTTKILDTSPEHFNKSIDLRTKDQVVISAQKLGLEKIKSVTLFPKFLKNESNYQVQMTADKKFAVLKLLDKTKFKNQRVVIAVK